MGVVPQSPRQRPTIGFLLDNLFDGFEETLWTSIVGAAREQDVSLVCVLGGSLNPENSDREPWARNALFDLVTPENFDGIISLSASVAIFLEDPEAERFFSRLAPLPLLHLCRELSAPSLVVDNRAGVQTLMDHLIGHHGRQRVAFIRGLATSSDAEERYAAYRASLERHGLPFDPAYVFDGDYQRTSGIRAVQAFWDERRVRPDAIVGANDLMALYAMAELGRRGIDVPIEVAVAGFDDVAAASSSLPSLTTVRQPLEDLGRAAVLRVLAMLRGETVPRIETFPAQLVVRRSCGCLPVLGRWRAQEVQGDAPGREPGLAAVVERAAPELSQRLGRGSWAQELARAFEEASGDAPDVLLEALEDVVIRGMAAGVDPMRFYDVVHAMLRQARAQGRPGEHLAILAESCAQLVGTMASQARTAERIQAAEETKILQHIFLPVYLTYETFVKVLQEELPTLGMRNFFLCLFADPEGRQAQLGMHYDLEGSLSLADAAAPFPPTRLLPGGLRSGVRSAQVILPLHHLSERIGFAICDIGPMSPWVYESLSTQVSSVLKFTSLVKEVRRQATVLEEKVEERTRELREAQRQLVETAHQAGMAEVAVGVLHNVGNLLNSVSVCAEEIAARVDSSHAEGLRKALELLFEHRGDLVGFFSADPRALLLADYLDRVAEGLAQDRLRSREEAKQLLEKIAVIRDTIRALQDLARHGRQAVLREQVEIAGLVDAVIEIQRPLLLRHGVRLRRDFERPLPGLVTERAKLIHVLVNLVKNAVEAMRGKPEGERVLTIGGKLDETGWVRISVADSGEGIAPENLDRIFSFGFTTKTDGHGFGLHSCALHARQLGGALHATSAGIGLGATFALVLPQEPAAG
jgi:DNA-binding LacI/PurR family transcriptional regulator/signal transduction histidine kinase